MDPELRAVYEATLSDQAQSVSRIRESAGVKYADQKLQKLEELQGVKRLEHPTYKAEPYYRRIP